MENVGHIGFKPTEEKRTGIKTCTLAGLPLCLNQ